MRRLEIYVIRHGETEWNRHGRFQGHADSSLTETGARQVRRLARRLRRDLAGPAAIDLHSSPLMRCRQTTAVLCGDLGWDSGAVRFDDRLMERHYGGWQGLTETEVDARYPGHRDAWAADPDGYAMPDGGESYGQLKSRLAEWLGELPGTGPVIAVTHTEAAKALRGLLTGMTDAAARDFDQPQDVALRFRGGAEALIGPDSP